MEQILTHVTYKVWKIQTIFQTLCHVHQNLFHTFIEAKAIDLKATELKLEFSGICAMSYEFSRRGGVAHKMDSNFSMLGAMMK